MSDGGGGRPGERLAKALGVASVALGTPLVATRGGPPGSPTRRPPGLVHRVLDRTAVHPEVYGRAVTRTNIDIDDDLVFRVMRRFNLPSKRAAVDMALRRLLGEPMTRDEILALQGVGWSGDLERSRRAESDELG